MTARTRQKHKSEKEEGNRNSMVLVDLQFLMWWLEDLTEKVIFKKRYKRGELRSYVHFSQKYNLGKGNTTCKSSYILRCYLE